MALATPARTPPRSCLARCTRQLAVLVRSGMGALSRPTGDRPRPLPAPQDGDLADHPAVTKTCRHGGSSSPASSAQPAGPNCVSTGCRIGFGTPRTPHRSRSGELRMARQSAPTGCWRWRSRRCAAGGSSLAQRSTASPRPIAGPAHQHRAGCRLAAGRVDVAHGCWPGRGRPVERQRPATAARRPQPASRPAGRRLSAGQAGGCADTEIHAGHATAAG